MIYRKGPGGRVRGGFSRFWPFGAGSPRRIFSICSTDGPLAILMVVGLLAGGCATAAAQQPINGNLNSVLSAAAACVQRVKADPEYAPLHRHSEETDGSLVSDREISLLLDESSRSQTCVRPLMEESFSKTYPSLAVLFADEMAQSQDNLIALLRKRESWGAYVRRGHRLGPEFTKEIDTEVQRIEAANAAPSASPRGRTQHIIAALRVAAAAANAAEAARSSSPPAGLANGPPSASWSGHYYRMAVYGQLEKWDFYSNGAFLHEGIVGGAANVRGEERGTYVLGDGWIELHIQRTVTAFTTAGEHSALGAGSGSSTRTVRYPFRMLGNQGSDGILLNNEKYSVRHGW